jgi:predicted DNA-binding antitoxin AbrB/MazE fold protein
LFAGRSHGFIPTPAAVYYSGVRSTFLGAEAMTLTVEAVYENGVFKPTQALPLKEHERVQLTVETKRSWVEETAGIMGFKGTVEEADFFAMDAELDYPPAPEES